MTLFSARFPAVTVGNINTKAIPYNYRCPSLIEPLVAAISLAISDFLAAILINIDTNLRGNEL